MLFPHLPYSSTDARFTGFQLPDDLARAITHSNRTQADPGGEYRLQNVYGWEHWTKLKSLGLASMDWANADVMDVCAGKGLVSYHLLQRVTPRSMLLADINQHELGQSKELLGDVKTTTRIRYDTMDILDQSLPEAQFDLIIGNSYLHHFYDVPHALRGLLKLLKPGGKLVSLHEPTPLAMAYECASVKRTLSALRRGPAFVDRLRPGGEQLPDDIGGDVWLFTPDEMKSLLAEAGYSNVRLASWHFIRTLLVGKLRMHLGPQRPRLSTFAAGALRGSIAIDSLLRRVLPARMFGSIAFAASRPTS